MDDQMKGPAQDAQNGTPPQERPKQESQDRPTQDAKTPERMQPERPRYTPPPPPRDENLHPHGFAPRAQILTRSRLPRVLISPDAYKRMQLYIELARKEVGWLGTVTRLDNGDFFIEEVFLLEQEVTPTETELSVEGQGKLVDELIAHGDAGIEQVNRLRFWGHSHVRMQTSPSGTDERTMERWQSEGLPWAVRGIFNKLGRAEFTLYLYDQGYRICDAPWAVLDPETKREMLTEVRRRPSYFGGNNGGGYAGNYYGRPNYWNGGGQSAHQSIFSGGSQESELYKAPAELQPSDELRKQVTEEFAAKVSERMMNRWFSGGGRDDNWSPTYDGPSYHDGASPYEGHEPYRPQPWQQNDRSRRPYEGSGGGLFGTRQEQPKKSGWSFWKWLLGQPQDTGVTPGPDTTGGDTNRGGGNQQPPSDRSDTQ